MDRCEYFVDNMCHHTMNLTVHCGGIGACSFIRNSWREDIAMEMRHDIMIDVDAFPEDWHMLAEYFTHK